LLALVGAAHASRLILRTMAEVAGGAEVIFVGRCEEVTSHWNDDRSLILTANRFRVHRVIKGKAGSSFTVTELGGTVGAKSLMVSGVPRYAVGEEVLICLRRTELGRWETFGAGQGRFLVARDARGRLWVRNDFYRSQLAAMAPGGPSELGAPLSVVAGRLQSAPPSLGVR
jgi:hypothetical protein